MYFSWIVCCRELCLVSLAQLWAPYLLGCPWAFWGRPLGPFVRPGTYGAWLKIIKNIYNYRRYQSIHVHARSGFMNTHIDTALATAGF